MTTSEGKEKKRFENINSMLLIAFFFVVFGLLVILAAYFVERYNVNLGDPINIYIYSAIPFTIAGILVIIYLILWFLNYPTPLENKDDPQNLE